jgi:hypothetical protein
VDLAILSDGLRSWQLTDALRTQCLAETARVLKPGAKALLLDYMAPRYFAEFVKHIDESALQVTAIEHLGDRLYYTVERVLRSVHFPVGFLASEGLAKTMRALSQVGGKAGSKHIAVIAQARV